jgi:hypothetical protein
MDLNDAVRNVVIVLQKLENQSQLHKVRDFFVKWPVKP